MERVSHRGMALNETLDLVLVLPEHYSFAWLEGTLMHCVGRSVVTEVVQQQQAKLAARHAAMQVGLGGRLWVWWLFS